MLEYLAPLKSGLDILNGVLQLRKATPDRAVFNDYVTPAFESMSKIVDDYLAMFTKLEMCESGLDREALNQFYRDRMKLRALRLQVRAMFDAIRDRPELARFHMFFELTDLVFGGTPYSSVSLAFQDFVETGVDAADCLWVLGELRREIEDHWRLLSVEYARLKLDFAT